MATDCAYCICERSVRPRSSISRLENPISPRRRARLQCAVTRTKVAYKLELLISSHTPNQAAVLRKIFSLKSDNNGLSANQKQGIVRDAAPRPIRDPSSYCPRATMSVESSDHV